MGESEVVRRLAENPRLDQFRPFPDLEMVDVLARDNINGRYAGLQVKPAAPGEYGEAHIHVRKSTFVPAATTLVAGLAWLPDEGRFADECLLVPTERFAEVAVDGGDRLGRQLPSEHHSADRARSLRHPVRELGAFAVQIVQGT